MNNTNCRQDSRDLCCLSIGIFGCLFLFLLFAYPFFCPACTGICLFVQMSVLVCFHCFLNACL
jgi:hypothetical protein